MTADKICLGKAELTEAERLRSQLARRGISMAIMHNAMTCTKGCAITVEMWVNGEDLPAIEDVIAEQKAKRLEGLDFDASLLEQVFDPSKDTAVCPACGTAFATSQHECPDCGLAFASLPASGGGCH